MVNKITKSITTISVNMDVAKALNSLKQNEPNFVQSFFVEKAIRRELLQEENKEYYERVKEILDKDKMKEVMS